MLIGGVGGPYGGELYTVRGVEDALGQRPHCQFPAGAKRGSRSHDWGRIACGAFRVNALCGDRVALQAKWVVPQDGRRHGPAELGAWVAACFEWPEISTAGIVGRCRNTHKAPGLVEAQVE